MEQEGTGRTSQMPQAGKAVIKGTTPREGLTQPGVYNEERRKAILYFTTTTKDLSIGNKKRRKAMKRINETSKCEYPGCEEKATTLAAYVEQRYMGSVLKVGRFCAEHAELVAGHHSPEYVAECPNCQCHFGVN